MEEEDFFSDGGLDKIPDNTLRELEQNAISSTQRPTIPRRNAPPPVQKPVAATSSVAHRPRTAATKNIPWRPPQVNRKLQSTLQTAPPASAPEPPSSDYGFDDEDVIDLDEPSMVIQPAPTPGISSATRLQPSAAPGKLYAPKAELDPETAAAYAAADAELGARQSDPWPRAASVQTSTRRDINAINISSLQARIAELESEQARLRQAEQDARTTALAKQGEIAIVRSNQDKVTREYERRIEVMRKVHADEAAKQKAELEAGRKEREKIETDNRFLQHDLAQEADRAKRLNGPGKARVAAVEREKGTPRKVRRVALGDGFDDDDFRVLSPSKSRDRPKDATPKAGAKRKRNANDSPIAALSFTQLAPPEQQVGPQNQPQLTRGQLSNGSRLSSEIDRYEYMQRLLKHCPWEGHERSVEALSKHTLPSTPGKSLAASLIDLLSFSATLKEDYMPLRLCRVLIRLWSRCMDDIYYAALYLLLDLMRFALYLELASVKSQLIEEAVPLCIRTIDVVTLTAVRASVNPTWAAGLDHDAQAKATDEIDVDEILELMLDLVQAAALTGDRLAVFWRYMDFTFTLMLLHKAQPISQVKTALQLLTTSTLETTFGPISQDPEEQITQERGMLDRLTIFLFDMPQVPPHEPAYGEDEIAELRVEILNVFKAMCLTDHGGSLLANHRSAIGRLVHFLDAQVNKLYTVPPNYLAATSKGTTPTVHDLIVKTVNTTVRLLYHVLRTYDADIDFSQKHQVIHCGFQKFLTGMTRVAFSEQLVFEQGIEDEAMEAAHAILDNVLSPEEGENLIQAVETSRGTSAAAARTGQTTEVNTSKEVSQVGRDTVMGDHG